MADKELPTHPYPPQILIAPPEEDAIDLAHLWGVFHCHLRTFWITVGVTLLLGLAVAFLLPKKYGLSTTLALGDSTATAVALKAKLENDLVPRVLTEVVAVPEDRDRYPIEVKVPKGVKGILALSSKGTDEDLSTLRRIHADLVKAVIADDQPAFMVAKKAALGEWRTTEIQLAQAKDPTEMKAALARLEEEKRQAEKNLADFTLPVLIAKRKAALEAARANAEARVALADQAATFAMKNLERLDTSEKELQQRIQTLEKRLAASSAPGASGDAKEAGPPGALAEVMAGRRLDDLLEHLGELRDRLYVTLPLQRGRAHKMLEDARANKKKAEGELASAEAALAAFDEANRLQQAIWTAKIAKIEADMDKIRAAHERKIHSKEAEVQAAKAAYEGLRPIRAMGPPVRSPRPVSTPRRVILLLALVIGVFLGFIAVAVAHFRGRLAEAEAQA